MARERISWTLERSESPMSFSAEIGKGVNRLDEMKNLLPSEIVDRIG
jgi:hypothetical protein